MDRRSALRCVLVTTFGGGLHGAMAQTQPVALAVVVSAQSALRELSLPDLRRLYTSEHLLDPAGHPLVPFNHPPRTPDRVGFDRAVLGMDPSTAAKYWIDRRIRGQPGPPRTVDSLELLLKAVAKLPGGVGYVRTAYVRDLRALRIDGVLPGKPGYKIAFSE